MKVRISNQIERYFAGLIEALPQFDKKRFEAAVREARERPRTALHFLLGRFTSGQPADRALAARLLAAVGGPEVIDNLNAVVFDVEQDTYTRLLANDLLARLGAPVDEEVFEMSVPGWRDFEGCLPSRVLDLISSGKTPEAVERARTLEPAERFMLIHEAAALRDAHSLQFLEAMAFEGDREAAAVISAVGAEGLQEGVELIHKLQARASRELQKLIRKTLFEMRKAGIQMPEERPAVVPTRPEKVEDSELPLYRALATDETTAGTRVVTVARKRPDGRLKVFSVVVDYWKRGIRDAVLRVSMSRSAFERLASRREGTLAYHETSIEECRRIVARGLKAAKEFGAPLPFDFTAGVSMLGGLDAELEKIKTPFLCSSCGRPLDEETIGRIKECASYDNIPVETRCEECRREG